MTVQPDPTVITGDCIFAHRWRAPMRCSRPMRAERASGLRKPLNATARLTSAFPAASADVARVVLPRMNARLRLKIDT